MISTDVDWYDLWYNILHMIWSFWDFSVYHWVAMKPLSISIALYGYSTDMRWHQWQGLHLSVSLAASTQASPSANMQATLLQTWWSKQHNKLQFHLDMHYQATVSHDRTIMRVVEHSSKQLASGICIKNCAWVEHELHTSNLIPRESSHQQCSLLGAAQAKQKYWPDHILSGRSLYASAFPIRSCCHVLLSAPSDAKRAVACLLGPRFS